MELTFLRGALPMTKTFTWSARDERYTSAPYPMLQRVSSYTREVASLDEFATALNDAANDGACLLKGSLDQPLDNESRAGHSLDKPHEWVVFDFDGVDCEPSFEGAVQAIGKYLPKECRDVDCLVQLSSSAFRPDTTRLSAHVFMLLETPKTTAELTDWLTRINFTAPLDAELRLTDSGMSLHFPLDRTVTSPAKLIYIAPPRCVGFTPRIDRHIDINDSRRRKLTVPKYIPVFNDQVSGKINDLRAKAGMAPREWKTRKAHGLEILLDAEPCVVHDIRPSGAGFIRFNMNGGDSHAYFINVREPALIGNFKGEPYLQTVQVAPELFKALTKAAHSLPAKIPPATIEPLAFYATNRESTIYIGSYDREHDVMRLDASNIGAAMSWMTSFGVPRFNLPHYDITYDMTSEIRFEDGYPIINLYRRTEYIKQFADKSERTIKCDPASLRSLAEAAPTWYRVIRSAVGSDDTAFLYFINWIAAIFQKRDRTMSAWVLHGTQGCIAGDTIIDFNRGNRNGGRPLTVAEAYAKWTGQYKLGTGRGKTWDMSIDTRTKSVRDGMTIGFHEVFNIVQSGEKQLYRLTSADGRSIRVTAEHPFMRPDGSFTPLKDLRVGDEVVVEGPPINALDRGGRDRRRVTVYSIPHHPHAWQHVINGKNYKRSHRARLVIEAEMNGLSLDAFIRVLRTKPELAARFKYLPEDVVVHHLDEDPGNDAPDNLALVYKEDHDRHHAKETGMGYLSTYATKVVSVTEDAFEMTYDLVMKAPYHNYIANGFAVHNTGKGLIVHNLMRPLFGDEAVTQTQYNLLKTDFNGYMHGKLVVVFNEVEMPKDGDWSTIRAKLYDWITEPIIPIHFKKKDIRDEPNFANIILCANGRRPIVIEDGDRRFNVGVYQTERLFLRPNEYAAIVDGRELEPMAKLLGDWQVNEDMLIRPFGGADKDRIIDATHSLTDAIARAIKEGDVQFFMDNRPDALQLRTDFNGRIVPINEYNDLLRAMLDDTLNVLSTSDLYVLFRTVAIGSKAFPDSKADQRRVYQRYGLLGDRVMHCQRTGKSRRGINAPKWLITKPLRKELEEMLMPVETNVTPIRRSEA